MAIQEEQDWRDIIHRCFRCGYCKFTYDFIDFNCPSYKKHRFESYSTGGRIWLIYGLMTGELHWSPSAVNVLYSCSTCGNCMENCRFDKFNHFIVDFIEAGRLEAVKRGFCPEKQKFLIERISNTKMYNPYGENNSDNEALKKEYNLSDKAEWVYYIGCTSNYRQRELRDATLRLLKKLSINFTLIDEHCCTSPLLRTGQIEIVNEFITHNISKIRNSGAIKVVTSCAGCYRTFKSDYKKFGEELGFEVYHTGELIKTLLEEGKITIKSKYERIITYHDPCHLGRHMGTYEIPREIINAIPDVKFVEMKRNKENAWCCGAGGGVKIGYPDWAIEISKERLEEAKETGATVITSMCPFCKTNLSDANDKFNMGFEIIDLIEILDQLEIEIKD